MSLARHRHRHRVNRFAHLGQLRAGRGQLRFIPLVATAAPFRPASAVQVMATELLRSNCPAPAIGIALVDRLRLDGAAAASRGSRDGVRRLGALCRRRREDGQLG